MSAQHTNGTFSSLDYRYPITLGIEKRIALTATWAAHKSMYIMPGYHNTYLSLHHLYTRLSIQYTLNSMASMHQHLVSKNG